MSIFLQSLSSEWLKRKRTAAAWLVVIGGIFVPSLVVLARLQAVDKVQAGRGRVERQAIGERPFIFVKTEYRLERVQLDELLYIEGMRDYRRIYTSGKQIMTLQTFGELEQAIPPGRVCRIHKSYLVALDKIDSVGRETVRIGPAELPISDTYRKAFLAMIS